MTSRPSRSNYFTILLIPFFYKSLFGAKPRYSRALAIVFFKIVKFLILSSIKLVEDDTA